MMGCESDRSVYALFHKGSIGSKSLMIWLEFILNTFLVVADACEGVNHKRFVQVRTAPKNRSTHIPNYQSSEHELSQHDESD